MNSAIGPSFKVDFVESRTCGSREQCTRPSQKNADARSAAIQTQPQLYFSAFLLRNFSLKVTKRNSRGLREGKKVGIELRASELILNVKAKWPMQFRLEVTDEDFHTLNCSRKVISSLKSSFLYCYFLFFFYESTVISWHSLVDSCTCVILFKGKIYA